ncbi:unnamed protein product [Paramecium sonneborni]|uniref:Uncharacterized protein n=1 Tax=Paramecium sonneborni TaxID=65129 RepID=A0A8S1MN63_9CILI|nr:unnamed protein product [Paramecium sonneborni]
MLQKILTLIFALLELFVLYYLHFNLDQLCTQIVILKQLLAILSLIIPALKNIKCSLLLQPIQTSIQFGFFSYFITNYAIVNFILSVIIRLFVIAFIIIFPFFIFLTMKLCSFLNFVGLIISIYLLIDLSWKTGVHFQYNLRHAQIVSLIPGFIYIYYLFTCENIVCKLSILLPLLQFIITDKGSLITSLMVCVFMMQTSILTIYIIQSLLLFYVIFGMKNKFAYILIGFIISCTVDITESSMTQILYFIIYVITLIQTRLKQKLE